MIGDTYSVSTDLWGNGANIALYFSFNQTICKLSGWKASSDKYVQVQELFIELWRSLQDCADENFDGRITEEEWV